MVPTVTVDRSALATAPRSIHVPVMLREVVRGLKLAPGQVVVDATVGGGGHAKAIANAIEPGGVLIGLDRDASMLDRARGILPQTGTHLYRASYSDLGTVLTREGRETVDRILVDLGLSSDQLEDRDRGFSFHSPGPLDLRFDVSHGEPASVLLQQWDEAELERVLREYGEEPHSRQIAQAIVSRRRFQPVATSQELAELVSRIVGGNGSREKHPATRVFQALRIAVNRELEHLQHAMRNVFPHCLRPGGLLAVITFHSLEDRLVKDTLRQKEVWDLLTPKPIVPTPVEERVNPRSRSAKLRIARRAKPHA